MKISQLRKLERAVHLAAAAVLFAYLYAPLGEVLRDAVRFVVFPILTMSGIGMWKGASIIRRLRAARRGLAP